MKTTMDSAGRLVIPSKIRREAALEPGVALEVRWRDGVIEIEPQPTKVKIQRGRHLWVASPTVPIETLDASTVERTRREILTSRGRRAS